MNIYSNSISDFDREIMIENARLDNEFNRLQIQFEMTNLQLAQMYKDAELKVFKEGGTYDDLAQLMVEADNAVAPQKAGILESIFNAIVGILKGIGNTVSKIFNTGNDNDTVEAPSDIPEKGNAFVKIANDASNGLTKISSGDWSGALGALKLLQLPLAVGAGKFIMKRYAKRQLKQISENVNKAKDKLLNAIERVKTKIFGEKDPEKTKTGNTILGKFREISNYGKKMVDAISGWVSKALGGIKNKNGQNDNQQNNTQDNTQNTNQQNTNNQNNNQQNQNNGNQPSNKVVKKIGNFVYRIDRVTAGVQVEDSRTKKLVKTDFNRLPGNIKQISLAIKNGTYKESCFFMDTLNLIAGENYTVEMTDTEVLVTDLYNESNEMMDLYEESLLEMELEELLSTI